MRLTLVRHATLLLDCAGSRLLVDPMLDPAAARDPIERTPNQVRNPLVELPMTPEAVVEGVDAVLVTHLHQDHFDDGAAAALPRDVPLVCQPEDVERQRARGFSDLRPLADSLARHVPDVVVLNGGGARFLEGEPIVMTAAEIVELAARIAPATVIAVHLESINHCLERRPVLHDAIAASGVENVLVPADGETLEL